MNRDLLCSTGNHIQDLVITYTETEFENISRITSFEIGRNGEEVILSKKKNTKKSWNRRSSQETQPQCHENWEAVEADK